MSKRVCKEINKLKHGDEVLISVLKPKRYNYFAKATFLKITEGGYLSFRFTNKSKYKILLDGNGRRVMRYNGYEPVIFSLAL